MQLDGRVALVTGAGSGIGSATAQVLAARGARVICADLEPPAAVAGEIGPGAEAVALNVASEVDWLRFAQERQGHVDILVQSAGIFRLADLADETVDHWEHVLAVNLQGAWLGMKHILPIMENHASCSVVNIGSAVICRSTPLTAAYTTSKAGLGGLTMQAAAQYAPRGIRINAVAPGTVDTPMWQRAAPDPRAGERLAKSLPIGRLANAEEIASVVAFLVSDDASYMVGQTLIVDGGWSISDAALTFD